jgi:hypothetical protein
MLLYFFAGFFESHLVYDQTQGSGAVFFLTLWITLLSLGVLLLGEIPRSRERDKTHLVTSIVSVFLFVYGILVVLCFWKNIQISQHLISSAQMSNLFIQ